MPMVRLPAPLPRKSDPRAMMSSIPVFGARLCGALVLAALATAPGATPAAAAKSSPAKLERSLMKLDPAELVAQVCDLAAMKALARSADYKKTDRVLIDAAATPRISGNKVTGSGGALRQHESWYRFSYVCTLAPDHMSVRDFTYKIVGPIPEEKWADIGLWR